MPVSTSISKQARIKKIMQLDDDVGKVAASVPLIICILVLGEVFNDVCSVKLYAVNMHLLMYWYFLAHVGLLWGSDTHV